MDKTVSNDMRLLLLTGFCGGFSTYATFIFETDKFVTDASPWLAIGNVMLNFILCLVALGAGNWLAKVSI